MARSKRRREEEEEEEEEEVEELEEKGQLDPEQEGEEQQQEDEAGPSNRGSRSEYPRGTVKKVRVYNFMTYGAPAVTITPGPRLNLVLGPNGTGKSSLVCALCMGLGGSPKLLGRADNMKDFIRRGADSGWVETTLSGGPGRADKVIRLEVARTAEGYTTRWRINGASKTMKEVKELVKSLNIQFDNLCQFLPQDKVVEFARMNPYELLVATEKAIGDASLYETHTALIAKRDTVKQKEQERNALQARHDQLVSENEKLEREYQRFEKKQKLQKTMTLIKKKLAWMNVREAQERMKEAQQEEKGKVEELKEAKKAAKGDERPAKQRRDAANAARSSLADVQQEVKRLEKVSVKAQEKVNNEENAARQLRTQLEGLEAESQKMHQDIESLRKKLDNARTRLQSLPPVPDHSAQIAELTQQQNAINEQIHNIETEKMGTINDLAAKRMEYNKLEAEVRECQSVAWRRLQQLSHVANFRGLHEAALWVQQQRDAGAFQGQVVGPLGVEIKVRMQDCARYLEQSVFGQMCNFAVQNRDDEKRLMEEFKKRNLNRLKVIVVTNDINTPITSLTARYRNFGVVCSLDETYDAPPLVKHALNNTCFLDQVYVLNRHNLDEVRQLFEQGLRNVFTPEQNISYIKSAYGTREDASLLTRNINDSRVLGVTGSVSDADERIQQLQGQMQQVAAQISQLEASIQASDNSVAPLHQQIEQLQQEKSALSKEMHSVAQQRSRIQTGLRSGENLLADKQRQSDPLSKAPALERQLKMSLDKHHKALTEFVEATVKRWELLQAHAATELSMRELDMQARAMEATIAAQKAAVDQLERELKTAHERTQALVRTYQTLKREAEEEHPLDAAATQAFAELADEKEELASDLVDLEAQVDNITVSNPRVAQEYRARKEDIDSKAKALADLNQQLEADTAQIEQLKANWLPELKRVVGLINTTFSINFSQIGCAGEVLLGEHEDYDRFSIQIKVKFRENEELQLLTAHRQSGGERSVSTIMYLIALQGVTVTPFRVVDEINQGMDPTNERKVFEQLVVASCQEGTPQCFLLTPKLLPDLPFTEDITVLNIFNSGLISDQVAGNYSLSALFGRRNLDLLLQRGMTLAGLTAA